MGPTHARVVEERGGREERSKGPRELGRHHPSSFGPAKSHISPFGPIFATEYFCHIANAPCTLCVLCIYANN
jgi:hypothetical protein